MSVVFHNHLSILENGNLLFKSPNSEIAYIATDKEVRQCLEFDEMIRHCETQQFDHSSWPIPASYLSLTDLFNGDKNSPYGLSQLLADGSFVIVKDPIPPTLVIPKLLETEGQLESVALAKQQQDLLTRLMLDAAEREARRNEKARIGFSERKEKRGRKAHQQAHTNAMKALAKLGATSAGCDGRPAKRKRDELFATASSPAVSVITLDDFNLALEAAQVVAPAGVAGPSVELVLEQDAVMEGSVTDLEALAGLTVVGEN